MLRDLALGKSTILGIRPEALKMVVFRARKRIADRITQLMRGPMDGCGEPRRHARLAMAGSWARISAEQFRRLSWSVAQPIDLAGDRYTLGQRSAHRGAPDEQFAGQGPEGRRQ